MTRDSTRFAGYKRRKTEGGFTLFLALFAVLFLSGYILVNLNVDSDRTERQRAQETAWLVEQLAEAARLYVRDEATDIASPYARLNLCAAPRNITVNELVNNDYIRDTIGQLNPAGTNYVTPLGQTVRIVAGVSDLSVACTDEALTGVASSAYLILEPGARTNRQNVLYLAEALASRGITINPPTFDAAGVNVSPNCGGAPGTIQWNTGCLTNGQYTTLAGAAGGGAFALNTIGLPAWLSFRSDSRAIFRYPQPENPQAQRMVTDLAMAEVTPNPLEINTGTAMVNSGVNLVTDDDAALADNRRGITNIGRLMVDRVIVSPQLVDVSGGVVVVDPTPDLNISGTATIGTAGAPASVRSFAQTANSMTAGNMSLSGASTLGVLPGGGVAPLMQVTGVAEMGTLQAATADVATVSSAGPTSIEEELEIVSGATVSGADGVIVNQLTGSLMSLDVDNNAVISTPTAVTGTTTVTGIGGLSFATARLDAATVNMQGPLTVGSDISVGSTANLSSINSVGTCYGDCPDRDSPGSPLD